MLLMFEDCYCLPTNQNGIFNQSLVDIQFSLSISTENMFCSRNEKSSVIGFIQFLWNQSNRRPTFSIYFCQGIV